MAIFTEETGRVVIQGLTGGAGRNFAQNMALSGTNLVAGVRPGRGGEVVFGVPCSTPSPRRRGPQGRPPP